MIDRASSEPDPPKLVMTWKGQTPLKMECIKCRVLGEITGMLDGPNQNLRFRCIPCKMEYDLAVGPPERMP